jgi:O-antigen/teichoic acid export membrane protein
MGSTWFDLALRVVYLIAITRLLGAEQYGAWSYALVAYSLVVGAGALGLEALTSIRIGADKETSALTAASAAALRLGVSCIGACGLIAFAFLAEDQGMIRTALLLVAPALIGRGVANLVRSIFVGCEAVGKYFKMSASIRAGEVLAGIAILLSGGDVISILVLHAASWVTEATMGLYLIRRLPLKGGLSPSRQEMISLVRQGAKLGLSAAFVAWLLAGPVMLLRRSGESLETLGHVALCLQAAAIIVATGHALLSAALPVLSRTVAAGDGRARIYAPLVALIAVGCTVPGVLLFHLFGADSLRFVLGEEYAPAGVLLAPAVLIAGLTLAPTGYFHWFTVNGRVAPAIVANGAGGALFTIAAPFAITHYAAPGVIYAAIIGWFFRALFFAGMAHAGARGYKISSLAKRAS